MNTLPISRKKAIKILFLIIAILIIWIFKVWYNEKSNEQQLSYSVQNATKPNKALNYSNLAIFNYFNAENQFSNFLEYHNSSSMYEYKNSLKIMSKYLDSLKTISNSDKDFSALIASKQNKENDIIKLKKELDSLIKNDNNNYGDINLKLKSKKYDYSSVLGSISYDTIKDATEVKKKGLFGRIGNALSGKSDVKKENTQVKIKMVFNNEVKTGTFEEQLKNIFSFTEAFHQIEIKKIRTVYSNLKEKDRILLSINKSILDKCQNILLLYSKSAQELNRIKYSNALELYSYNVKNQKNLIFSLLVILILAVTFMIFLINYSFKYELELEKANLEAERNLETKNTLVGMLSHEMRAPLNIISNFSNKLKELNSNPNMDNIINSMHFTSNSLQITVNQILDFFKNKNNKLTLYNSNVEIKNEIASVLESLKSISEVKNIQIISNVNVDKNITVWADCVKIHQLFYNIIGNAIKFTKIGSITVDVKMEELNDKHNLLVKITDTGVGIPEKDIKKVFDKLYQSDEHQEQINFGAGLGLSLCKDIIDMFHGEISVKSELNVGTEISFNLLLEKVNIKKETSESILKNKFANKKIKIAVVDDDLIMLQLIKKFISNINFEVYQFESAKAIKDFLNTQIVDLIITDIQIFDYSGVDLAKDIKSMGNDNSKKPIIAMTANSYFETNQLKQIGLDEVILKPINKDEFYQKVLKVLS